MSYFLFSNITHAPTSLKISIDERVKIFWGLFNVQDSLQGDVSSLLTYFMDNTYHFIFILEGKTLGRGCSTRPAVFHRQCDSHYGSDHQGKSSIDSVTVTMHLIIKVSLP